MVRATGRVQYFIVVVHSIFTVSVSLCLSIGGSPNRGPDDALNSQIIRSGLVSMKEDSFANWLFQRKWLVLREQTLSIHKNKVRLLTYLNVLPLLKVLQTAPQQSVIMLNGISNIERMDMKPYCLLLETTDRRFYLSLKNDEELDR